MWPSGRMKFDFFPVWKNNNTVQKTYTHERAELTLCLSQNQSKLKYFQVIPCNISFARYGLTSAAILRVAYSFCLFWQDGREESRTGVEKMGDRGIQSSTGQLAQWQLFQNVCSRFDIFVILFIYKMHWTCLNIRFLWHLVSVWGQESRYGNISFNTFFNRGRSLAVFVVSSFFSSSSFLIYYDLCFLFPRNVRIMRGNLKWYPLSSTPKPNLPDFTGTFCLWTLLNF